MQKRSLGVTTLAFFSVMVALYSQMAAIALILTGSAFTPAGSMYAAAALVLGAVFLGVTLAGYAIGFGLWTRKHWAWASSVSLFATFAGVNIALSVLSTNALSSVLPVVGGAMAIWYLHRPEVKAELSGARYDPQRSTGSEILEPADALG